MLDGGGGVPVALVLVAELVEQDGDVAPGQLANRLLADCLLAPGRGHLPHVFEVAAGQAAHVGERGAQVGGEPVDNAGAPALLALALEHRVAQAPVQPEQLAVDHPLSPPAGGGDRALELLEQVGVAVR